MTDQEDVTGRDRFIVVEALAFAVKALSRLPIELRPDNNIADMKRLIAEYVKSDAGLGQVQQIAHRRLGLVLAHKVWCSPIESCDQSGTRVQSTWQKHNTTIRRRDRAAWQLRLARGLPKGGSAPLRS